VAPWAEEATPGVPNILRVLRGDFFCLPFGGNATAWKGERHPVHGETANADWSFVRAEDAGETSSLDLHLRTTIRRAEVDKRIELRADHPAVYCRHIIRGATGPMNPGHHAMLAFPAGGPGGRISTSPIGFGQVYPGRFEDPVQGGYSSLKQGAEFRALDRVPLAAGGFADLTRYPAREGFEDLVMVSAKPGGDFAWTAAVFSGEGYVWFSLKDPRVLASTVMWHSNGGRHYPPWNGRHRRVLGLEEVTSYFHEGLAESAAKNPVKARGIPTTLRLNSKRPTVVNVIMGVAAVPEGFGVVRTIVRKNSAIILRGSAGHRVTVPLDWEFLYGG
ncbi:MAG: hypothetical protein ACOYMS_05245, partial [Terrimicrobiaceae bacterium]